MVETDGPTIELQRLLTCWIAIQKEHREERLAVEERKGAEELAGRLYAVALQYIPAKKVSAYERDLRRELDGI